MTTFAGSQAEPGNPLRRGSASRIASELRQSSTRGRASKTVRSQAEPGNEESVGVSPSSILYLLPSILNLLSSQPLANRAPLDEPDRAAVGGLHHQVERQA